ncbi:MAG: CoB--CoM heterodisulfide reductase iron-sulfur subunit A family protein [Chloroflexia bacterium]|nr:CoB--CoM heterodisulfide reductase iron-sulfur subunit A family protein [Chloroflexia bacterium]
MRRIGVFVCHCGFNIASTVDVEAVAKELQEHPQVALATDYKYMCSQPGQDMIQEAIVEHNLDGVIVAACSPAMHEPTFRKACASAGLNPYCCEIANIREQCSWVHQKEPERATQKAIETIRTMVAKTASDEELEPLATPIKRRALVIGGGLAGLSSALDIAEAGYPVVLVERNERLGGKVAQLSGVYLNFAGGEQLIQQRIEAARSHPRIEIHTGTELALLEGYVGNFQARLKAAGTGDDQAGPPIDIGAVVVATGYDLFSDRLLGEYGSGTYPDVINGLEFERLLADPAGLRRPSDGQEPQQVVFVQCVRSRDPERGMPYCSRICCMYVAKQARLYKQRVPNGQSYVFYIDIRSAGKGYEEFVQQAMEEDGVLYIRGRVAKVFPQGNKTVVWGVDTLSGELIEVAADLVVLATAAVPSEGAVELAQRLRIATDGHGFFSEAHPKLRPVESLTAGIYLAGAAQAPKDIPDTVAQASGAAAKVMTLFSQDELVQEPTVAYVIEDICSGCGICVPACPYEARSIDPWRQVAVVNPALCQFCGACVAACPNKASQIHNWTADQILSMLDALAL